MVKALTGRYRFENKYSRRIQPAAFNLSSITISSIGRAPNVGGVGGAPL
jgi:hypothetical protein